MEHDIKTTDLLVLVDVQNDFLSGGALEVPEGNDILLSIQELALWCYDNVVLTQDWHPEGHASFASAHEGKEPFDVISTPHGEQTLWPDHCIQGSRGADFGLFPSVLNKAQAIIRKGFRPGMDSYSAFLENDRKTPTGLSGFMRERGLERAVFAGLAFDYCVGFSAIDACEMGFDSVVIRDATRAVSLGNMFRREAEMIAAGVQIV